MAPSSGPLLAPIAMRAIRHAIRHANNLIRTHIPRRAAVEQELVFVRASPRQPTHPLALFKQSKARFHSTVRYFNSTSKATARPSRASFPSSRIGRAVNSLTTRAPFASTLRPNLTGGCLPRSAGGYSLGGTRAGGVRHFSHTPAAPAQVINNVSQAVRAFWLSGQKAQYAGPSSLNEKKYIAVSPFRKEASRKLSSASKLAPGSYIDFAVSPTITAVSSLPRSFGGIAKDAFSSVDSTECEAKAGHLNADDLLDVLSKDFARQLQHLCAVRADLKRLAALGDLPIELVGDSTLRVRFPGCDARTVERLADEVGVSRGVVRQDELFDDQATKMALLFPFAPGSSSSGPSSLDSFDMQQGSREEVHWREMLSPAATSQRSLHSLGSFIDAADPEPAFQPLSPQSHNPWLDRSPASPDGYESWAEAESETSTADKYFQPQNVPLSREEGMTSSKDYEGLEGIYRFWGECNGASAR